MLNCLIATLCLIENLYFEPIPIFDQNKLQVVDQVTRNAFPWSIKAPCEILISKYHKMRMAMSHVA